MIWVDLDNTLIYSPDSLDRLAEKLAGPLPEEHRPHLEEVRIANATRPACVRPDAHEFLDALRRLGEVRLLTTATRAYAEAMNTHFKLGFTAETITAREDWMEFSPGLAQSYRPRGLSVDPAGVVIDDDAESIHVRLKLAYLGSRSLVTVPCYRGSKLDPFADEWLAIVRTVAGKLGGRIDAAGGPC
jgi:hypothetical protein